MALSPGVRALYDGIERRMRDVREVQLPRLTTCTLATELAEWESELQATLHRLATMVLELESEVDEAALSNERDGIHAAVQEAKRSMTSLRTESRRALLAAHRATLSQQATVARAALLGRSAEREASMPKDQAHATSDQLTTALQRTVALMSGELEKSGYSTQLLEESSATIAQVSERYTSFNELLRNSMSLVRQMERAELMDLGLLVGSMVFFAACVLYILYVRLFSKGLYALGLTWRATGFVGSGAISGVSSLSALLSSAAHRSIASPAPTHDILAEYMPTGYRDEDVVYEEARSEAVPTAAPSPSVLAHSRSDADASETVPGTLEPDEPREAPGASEVPAHASTDAWLIPATDSASTADATPLVPDTPALSPRTDTLRATDEAMASRDIDAGAADASSMTRAAAPSSRRARPWDDEL